jgi:Protein of unknown function (DUF3261)
VRRPLLLVALLLAAAACAHRDRAAQPPEAPPSSAELPPLPPPDAIPGTFTVRQKLTARSKRGGGSFEAVLQKQAGKLILVGLTPYGARAFVLEQTPSDVKFTSYLPRELPFPPAFILMDVHRVFGQWLGPPPPDGERTGTVRGERVRELWRGGAIVTRTFATVDAAPQPTTTITYAGQGPSGLAAHVTLANARLGYTLLIETLPL